MYPDSDTNLGTQACRFLFLVILRAKGPAAALVGSPLILSSGVKRLFFFGCFERRFSGPYDARFTR
jgi:hypothetical protein